MSLKNIFLSILVLALSQVGFSQIYSVGNNAGFAFSYVEGEGAVVPLPIELTNFIAYVQNSWVNLEWQTASEINNDYFTVEKSKTAIDWIIITKVNGAGNSSNTLSYSTTDQTPYNGISYYRLKQTDFDGKYSYSQIRAVNFNDEKTDDIRVYPNPVTDELIIEITGNSKKEVNFEIITSTGAVVYQASVKQKTTVQTSGFASGTYVIRFEKGNIYDFKKVIKE